jgi:hypothetical protein
VCLPRQLDCEPWPSKHQCRGECQRASVDVIKLRASTMLRPLAAASLDCEPGDSCRQHFRA